MRRTLHPFSFHILTIPIRISELVTPENGLLFQNSSELCDRMVELFKQDFRASTSKLKGLSEGVKSFQKVRWDDNWRSIEHLFG